MRKWLRRIRGTLGVALAWAAAWFGVGAIFGLVAGISSVITGVGAGLIFGSALFFPVLFGMCGFLGGAAFSVVLGITEGRRRFDEMSLPRFAAFGALGSVPISQPCLRGHCQLNVADPVPGRSIPLEGGF